MGSFFKVIAMIATKMVRADDDEVYKDTVTDYRHRVSGCRLRAFLILDARVAARRGVAR